MATPQNQLSKIGGHEAKHRQAKLVKEFFVDGSKHRWQEGAVASEGGLIVKQRSGSLKRQILMCADLSTNEDTWLPLYVVYAKDMDLLGRTVREIADALGARLSFVTTETAQVFPSAEIIYYCPDIAVFGKQQFYRLCCNFCEGYLFEDQPCEGERWGTGVFIAGVDLRKNREQYEDLWYVIRRYGWEIMLTGATPSLTTDEFSKLCRNLLQPCMEEFNFKEKDASSLSSGLGIVDKDSSGVCYAYTFGNDAIDCVIISRDFLERLSVKLLVDNLEVELAGDFPPAPLFNCLEDREKEEWRKMFDLESCEAVEGQLTMFCRYFNKYAHRLFGSAERMNVIAEEQRRANKCFRDLWG